MTDIFNSAVWAREAEKEYIRLFGGESSARAVLAEQGETIGSALVADLERTLDNGGDPSLTHVQWRILVAMAKHGLKST